MGLKKVVIVEFLARNYPNNGWSSYSIIVCSGPKHWLKRQWYLLFFLKKKHTNSDKSELVSNSSSIGLDGAESGSNHDVDSSNTTSQLT